MRMRVTKKVQDGAVVATFEAEYDFAEGVKVEQIRDLVNVILEAGSSSEADGATGWTRAQLGGKGADA